MPEITVWTKQNIAVLDQLEADGRFIADVRFIRRELEDTTDIMLFIYRWLTEHAPTAGAKPPDVSFPVWVSFTREATMKPEPGYVILELSVDKDTISVLDTTKWTAITNYSYIPSDPEDGACHNRMMSEMGISNAKAVMTEFYPEIRRKIIASWDRLFEVSDGHDVSTTYGIIWEVRKEWVRKVIM